MEPNKTPQIPNYQDNLKTKIILVVVGFVAAMGVLLVVFLVLLSGDDNTLTPLVEEDTSDQRVDRESIEGTQLEEVAINRSAEPVDGVELTARNVIDPFVAGGEFGLIVPVDSDNKYLAVDIEIVNNGELDIYSISPNSFSLFDEDGVEYDPTFDIEEEEIWAIGFRPFSLGTLEPGEDEEGYIIFEVPKSAGDLTLSYELRGFSIGNRDSDFDKRIEVVINQ